MDAAETATIECWRCATSRHDSRVLLYNYRKWGSKKVALRKKEFGIWREYTWAQFYENVKYFSLGLIVLGLEPRDKVTIIGDSAPEWLFAELAVQAAGGVSLGAYQDSVMSEVKYVVDQSDAKMVVAQDQEQVDKVLEARGGLPKVARVIYWDPKGLWFYEDPLLIGFDKVIEMGKMYDASHPGTFENRVNMLSPDDIAMICYTSGTTGSPKGSMFTHRGWLAMTRHFLEFEPLGPEDETMSYLPMAWTGEQGITILPSLVAGATLNFSEDPHTVQDDLREVGIAFGIQSARLLQSQVSMVLSKIADAGFLKRFTYRLFMPVGYRIARLRLQGQRGSVPWRLVNIIGYLVLFRPIQDWLGYSRIRVLYTGGALLGSELFEFFLAIGINLKCMYGLTEAGGIPTGHRNGDVRTDTSGPPSPGSEIRIDNAGEILLRCEGLSIGYYKNPALTAHAMRDGWLHTADSGIVDENGHVVIFDRMEDVSTLTSGQKFAPQYIESKMKFSPYIQDSVILGKDRDYLVCLISIDFDTVGKWAENKGITYTTFADLSQRPEIHQLVLQDIRRVNRVLPTGARIKKFAHLYKQLDADDAELTRTRKLRRRFIEERYRDLIEALFSERSEVNVETQVQFRDGRIRTQRIPVSIITVTGD